jgi:type I restriction enzyme S subunit
MKRWSLRPLNEFCVEIEHRCGKRDLPVFSVSKNLGILPQAERFKKRIASVDTSRYKVVSPGDFAFDPMLLWSGSISRHTSKTIGVVSPAYCVFRLTNGLNPRFLHLYLIHPDRLPFYDSISFGTNERRRKAQFSDFTELEIPVPPMTEQERIVKLLDEANELRKLRGQTDRRTAALVPSLFHDMFGDPDSNPFGWPVTHAGELMDACDYGTSQKANEEGRGIPVLRMGNVTIDGSLDLEELKTVELGDSELAKQRLQVGDVLFNRTNSRELVGKTGMWDGRFEAVPASYFIRVRFWPNAEHPQHFTTFMNLPSMKRRLAEMARGAVGQANINSKELKSIEFPVPPVKLQREFAARVSEIRAMQAEQAASLCHLDDLFQSLMHRAYTGEL